MEKMYEAFLDGQKHLISLVGAGGKTTVLYEMAEFFSAHGKKTLVGTTTHIYQPENNYAATLQQVQELWQNGKYAVIGRKSGNKLVMDEQLFAELKQQAEIILVEADGAKGLPCKVPQEHEPVILPECDIVIGLIGMDALGARLKDCCFRLEQAAKLLKAEEKHVLTLADMVRILTSEQGTKKLAEGRKYCIILNKCDDKAITAEAEKLRQLINTGESKPAEVWLRGRNTDE